MAEHQHDFRAHANTFAAFNKLVLFTILWVVLLLSSMALGLIGHLPIIALLLGIGGTFMLLIGFAIME
jgi:hypothetical protein